MNMKMLGTSGFFLLTSIVQPVIFATIAFYMFKAGRQPGTLLYVALGAAGLRVFSGGTSGLFDASGTLSATIGYLGGFVLAAGLVGRLAERGWDRSPASTIGLMVLGNLVIYAVGVPVLIAVTGLDLATAVRVGALDFAPWDLIKILGAAALLPLAWRAFGSRRDPG